MPDADAIRQCPRERFLPDPRARLREPFGEVARFQHLSWRPHPGLGCLRPRRREKAARSVCSVMAG